jgi:hypothetical protein
MPAKLRGKDDVFLFLYWNSREPEGRYTTTRHFSEKALRAAMSVQGFTKPQIDL